MILRFAICGATKMQHLSRWILDIMFRPRKGVESKVGKDWFTAEAQLWWF